jgi:hypothetical protein
MSWAGCTGTRAPGCSHPGSPGPPPPGGSPSSPSPPPGVHLRCWLNSPLIWFLVGFGSGVDVWDIDWVWGSCCCWAAASAVVVCVVIPSSDVILAGVRVWCRLIRLFLICWLIGLSDFLLELVSFGSSRVITHSLPLLLLSSVICPSASSLAMADVSSYTHRVSLSSILYWCTCRRCSPLMAVFPCLVVWYHFFSKRYTSCICLFILSLLLSQNISRSLFARFFGWLVLNGNTCVFSLVCINSSEVKGLA